MKSKINIGSHVSAAGGLLMALENAKRLNVKAIQIHATSPRQWQVRMPDKKITEEYKKISKELGITTYIHAPYLINLATPNKILAQKSLKNLIGNLQIGNLIGAKGVIFHLGSAAGWDKKKAIKQEIDLIKKAAKLSKGTCMILLENSANGSGELVGSTLDEIGQLLKGANSKKVGVCLDTAHLFGAGVTDYSPKSLKNFSSKLKSLIGKNLTCMHVNDSKVPFGANRDRHENIGQGHIGNAGFKNLSKLKSVRGLDWILEVPGYDGEGPDVKNISELERIVN